MNRMSDADILIVDPSIPLHSLIPVDDIRPNANPPLILGNEDKNGFNAGNMLFRVHIDLIYFLSHTFALADDTTKAYYNASAALGYLVKEGKNQIIETPPSDQKSMCLLMHKDKTFGSRFYQYPPRWLNWYESRWDDGTDSTATAGAMTRNSVEDDLVIQLHIHLVAGAKNWARMDPYVEREWIKWSQLLSMNTKELEARSEQVKRVSNDHWKTAKIGAPPCVWV
jgi:hypothetical protein